MTRRPPAVLVAALLLVTACGTRADDAQVRAGAAPAGEVTIAAETLDALRAAAQPQVGTVPVAGSDAATVPGTPSRPAGPAGPVGQSPGPDQSAAPGGTGGTGEGKPAAGSAGAATCRTTGVPVALGQVGTFSGLAGPIAGDGLAALAVWVKDVNARGGLGCHPVTLYVKDDGGDPARATAAVRDLSGAKGVVAFVGNITALSQAGFLPEIKKNCIPAVGINFGPDWSTEPCLFSQGAGWDESLAGLVRQAVDRGHSKIGLLYCVEIGTCGLAGKGIEAAAKRDGAELVYSAAVSLTQTDFTAQCQNAKNAGVEELTVAMEGSAMARLARSCLALNYRPLLVGAAFAINPAQAEDPGMRELGVATVNPNAPWFLTDQPGVRAYQAALKKYAPQILNSGITLQMWASGKLLEAGVSTLGASVGDKPLTSAQILGGLNSLKNETLEGLTAPLNFTSSNKGMRTSGCVYLALLGKNGWTAPQGSKPLCNLLPKSGKA